MHGIRLRHRRRRLGRLRARQPADGGCRQHACCCWRPAEATAIRGCTSRSATARLFTKADSTGSIQTEPEPALDGPRSAGRAARSSAARVDQRHGVHPRPARATTTTGRDGQRPAGATPTCCPISRRRSDYEGGADEYHGAGGPLGVSELRDEHPLCRAFVEARPALRLPCNADFNGAQQEGFGQYQLTIRERPALQAPRRAISIRRAAVEPDGADRRACDAHRVRGWPRRRRRMPCRRRRRDAPLAPARSSLAAGAMQSPQVLQLSGIGPADLLRASRRGGAGRGARGRRKSAKIIIRRAQSCG